MSLIREPTHAFQWYEGQPNKLSKQISIYLNDAKKVHPIKQIKAIIAPHAGYYYSGPTIAAAYKYLQPKQNLKLFLLGPTHVKYLKGCGLSQMKIYKTPLGPINLNTIIIQQLKQLQGFNYIDKLFDENEYSLEMHLPFIKNIFKNKPFTLIPVIVGALNQEMQQYYGKVFAKYFDDENTIFIISTDFCHWGKKYEFTYYNESQGQIWKSIQKLDGQALNIIQKHDQKQFLRYIEVTQNSICGRHPIGVFLRICKQSKLKLKTKFLKYSMSQRVRDNSMSSVSYASCITWIESKNK